MKDIFLVFVFFRRWGRKNSGNHNWPHCRGGSHTPFPFLHQKSRKSRLFSLYFLFFIFLCILKIFFILNLQVNISKVEVAVFANLFQDLLLKLMWMRQFLERSEVGKPHKINGDELLRFQTNKPHKFLSCLLLISGCLSNSIVIDFRNEEQARKQME